MQKSRVIVRSGVNAEPLLDTEDANQIEFYDCNGELIALVGHVFSNGLWFYSNRNDKDWIEVLTRTGYVAGVDLVGVPG